LKFFIVVVVARELKYTLKENFKLKIMKTVRSQRKNDEILFNAGKLSFLLEINKRQLLLLLLLLLRKRCRREEQRMNSSAGWREGIMKTRIMEAY